MDEIIRKTFEIGESKAIDPEHGIYEAWISTEAIDRDGDIMEATGIETENYMKNPVVLFGHSYRDPNAVIGKTLGLKIEKGKGIKARWQFAPPETNWNAQTVHRLWAGGFLNATSVGFIPKEYEPRETNDQGQPVDHGRRFKKWELLEFSIVPVPANQDALRLAVKALEFAEPTFTEDLEEEIAEPVDQKPYPGEHACRLRNPSDFQPDSFRRISRTSDGKKYHIIMGRLKGETTMTEQAYRYPKDVWSVSEARKHCKDHNGQSFEPASGSRDFEEECYGDDLSDKQEVKEEQADPDMDIDEELTDAELEELAEIVSDITEDLKR